MTLLLIDGDIIAYKASASAEKPFNWGDGHWTLHAFEDEVNVRIEDQISKLVEDAPVQDCIVALSDKDNFRKKIAPYYKANRNTHASLCCYPMRGSSSWVSTTQLYIED